MSRKIQIAEVLKPGSYLIHDCSHVSGGISYARERGTPECPSCGAQLAAGSADDGQLCPQCGGAALQTTITTEKQVDHKIFVKDSNNLKQSALKCVLRNHCALTQFGWVCDAGQLPALIEAYRDLDRQARSLNESAALAGSAVRVSIGFVPFEISADNVAAAEYIARTVREVCADLLDALRAGQRTDLANLFRRAKNLDRLATGAGQLAIVDALECARDARVRLNRTAREHKTLEGDALARKLADAGAALDLDAIEICIDAFLDLGLGPVDLDGAEVAA